MGAALWSTPDAVYVTVTMQCVTPLGGGPHDEYCSAPGGAFQSLYVNQGRGWRAVHHHQGAPYLEPVGALESGDLISVGWHCAVWKSSLDGSLECLGQRSSGSRSAFVRDDAVFHLGHDANHDNPVTRYADGAWTYLAHFTNFDDPRLLVDLGSRVLVAGGDGFAATLDPETGGTQRIAAPAGDYSEGVSWPDGRFALLHTAGLNYRVVLGGSAGWTTVGLELGIDSKLRAGPDSALYTNVGNALYRIDETGAYEAVLELQDAGVRDFSVNTDSEVFLSIEYPALQPYQCGRVVLAWFDGNQLHLM